MLSFVVAAPLAIKAAYCSGSQRPLDATYSLVVVTSAVYYTGPAVGEVTAVNILDLIIGSMLVDND